MAGAIRRSGAARFLLRLATQLHRRGWQVDLFAIEEPGDWFDLARSRVRADAGAVRFIEPEPGATRMERARRVGEVLREGRYDAVLLNQADAAQRSLGLLEDRVAAIPILHGDDPAACAIACSNRNAWNALVASSPKLFEAARARVSDRPILLIPHGVDLPSGDDLGLDGRASRPALDLVFAGDLDDARKGILRLPSILAAALARGARARLRIAGDGPDRVMLAAAFRDAGVGASVEYLGVLAPEEMDAILLDAHALLLPSRREGSPVAPLEAQACGCLPLCSNLPGATDATVEHRRTGFLLPEGDIDAFATEIVRLDRDRDLWRTMAARAWAAVRDSFSADAMGGAYDRLLAEARAGRYPLPASGRSGRVLADFSSLLGHGAIQDALRSAARSWAARRGRRA